MAEFIGGPHDGIRLRLPRALNEYFLPRPINLNVREVGMLGANEPPKRMVEKKDRYVLNELTKRPHRTIDRLHIARYFHESLLRYP